MKMPVKKERRENLKPKKTGGLVRQNFISEGGTKKTKK
jgi:hypothetical protein